MASKPTRKITMEQNFDIDELFRETLGNATDVPPSSAWNHISNQLNHGSASSSSVAGKSWFSKLGIVSKVAIVSSVVGLGGLGLYMMPENDVTSPEIKKEINTTGSENLSVQDSLGKLTSHENSEISVTKTRPRFLCIDQGIVYVDDSKFDSSSYNNIVKDMLVSFKELPKNSENQSASNFENQKSQVQEIQKIESNLQCKNTTILEHLPSGILDKDEKFLVQVSGEVERVKIIYGDGGAETESVVNQEIHFSHLYRVRDKKNFYVKVIAQKKDGCFDSAMTEIEVYPTLSKQEEIIPNVFTPNGDGKNDEYFVNIAEPLEYSMLIMDMKKNQIFYSQNKSETWRGNCGANPCENGLYEVVLKLKYTGEKEMIINKRIQLVRKGN